MVVSQPSSSPWIFLKPALPYTHWVLQTNFLLVAAKSRPAHHCGHFVELDLLQTYLFAFFSQTRFESCQFSSCSSSCYCNTMITKCDLIFFFNLLFSYYKVFYTLLFIMCPMLIEKLLWSSQSFAVGTRTFAPNVKKKTYIPHQMLRAHTPHRVLIPFPNAVRCFLKCSWMILDFMC